MNKKKHPQGFTLVEIIIVLVILAILAATMIPSFIRYIDKAADVKYLTASRSVETAIKTISAEMYGDGYDLIGIKLNNAGTTGNQINAWWINDKTSIFKFTNMFNQNDTGSSSSRKAKAYYDEFTSLYEIGDLNLKGTSFIFFNEKHHVVSNSNHKIANQPAESQLIFCDKKGNVRAKLMYDDDKHSWYVYERK